jgi:hypothetical protein
MPDDVIHMRCPNCGVRVKGKPSQFARAVTCPKCKAHRRFVSEDEFTRPEDLMQVAGSLAKDAAGLMAKRAGGLLKQSATSFLKSAQGKLDRRKAQRGFDEKMQAALAAGGITDDEIVELHGFCADAGLAWEQAIAGWQEKLQAYVRKLAVEIVADGEVTEVERDHLKERLKTLVLDQSFKAGIWDTIERVEKIQAIREGDVQAISAPKLVLKNAEIPWFKTAAECVRGEGRSNQEAVPDRKSVV